MRRCKTPQYKNIGISGYPFCEKEIEEYYQYSSTNSWWRNTTQSTTPITQKFLKKAMRDLFESCRTTRVESYVYICSPMEYEALTKYKRRKR